MADFTKTERIDYILGLSFYRDLCAASQPAITYKDLPVFESPDAYQLARQTGSVLAGMRSRADSHSYTHLPNVYTFAVEPDNPENPLGFRPLSRQAGSLKKQIEAFKLSGNWGVVACRSNGSGYHAAMVGRMLAMTRLVPCGIDKLVCFAYDEKSVGYLMKAGAVPLYVGSEKSPIVFDSIIPLDTVVYDLPKSRGLGRLGSWTTSNMAAGPRNGGVMLRACGRGDVQKIIDEMYAVDLRTRTLDYVKKVVKGNDLSLSYQYPSTDTTLGSVADFYEQGLCAGKSHSISEFFVSGENDELRDAGAAFKEALRKDLCAGEGALKLKAKFGPSPSVIEEEYAACSFMMSPDVAARAIEDCIELIDEVEAVRNLWERQLDAYMVDFDKHAITDGTWKKKLGGLRAGIGMDSVLDAMFEQGVPASDLLAEND